MFILVSLILYLQKADLLTQARDRVLRPSSVTMFKICHKTKTGKKITIHIR